LLGKHGLLDTDGWKGFHSLAKRAKKMLRMVNQSKLRSYKTCKKYMHGFKVPQGYEEDAIRLNKLHGNDKWQGANKLEMDQLHQYDTFHDKGIRTRTPGEEFKKIQVHLVYACKPRILSCLFHWGVTIFPYVDKWTRACHWVSIGKRRTSQYSRCVTNENKNTCVGIIDPLILELSTALLYKKRETRLFPYIHKCDANRS
jgi:hypothetical protein